MGINLFTTKKVLWMAVGFILILGAVIFGPDKGIPEIDSRIKPHLGEWKVTEMTGYVNYEETGEGRFCESKKDRFYPVIDDDLTFIKFLEGSREPTLENIPKEVYDSSDIYKNSKGIFIFQFSFDNGGRTNKGIEPYGVTHHYTEVLKGLWTFETGYWGDPAELEHVQLGTLNNNTLGIDNNIVVIGEVRSGTSGGGKGSFLVTGQFKGEDRIEGQWVAKTVAGSWGEIKSPLACPWQENGSGTWVAVRK